MGVALCFFTREVLAKPGDERFGARGQLAIDQSFAMMATRNSSDDALGGGRSNTNVGLAPTVSWFVLPQVSVNLGVSLGAGWSTSDASSDLGSYTSLGGRTGLGYALPLTDHFSLWPSAGASLTRYWFDSGDQPGGATGDMFYGSVGASVPVLWHPAPHFFVGLGPAAFAVDSGGELGSLTHNYTTLGLTSTVGGYFSP